MSRIPEPAEEGSPPVSVRVGAVVPPEDPEDWTRPLTWVSALGMLAAPILAALWFVVAWPSSAPPAPMTLLLAATLAAGAAATGATQLGGVRASSATLGAALFAALVTVVAGAATGGHPPPGEMSPSVAHALAASVAGLGGATVSAVVALLVASMRQRVVRFAAAAAPGIVVAILLAGVVLGASVATPLGPQIGAGSQCEAQLAGRVVRVTYPADWSAGGRDAGAGCLWFAEAAVDEPSAAQILLGAAGGGPEPLGGEVIVSRTLLTVSGMPAVRVELPFDHSAGGTGRRVFYNVSLGPTLECGPIIVAGTDTGRPGDFVRNVAILDAMMRALHISREP